MEKQNQKIFQKHGQPRAKHESTNFSQLVKTLKNREISNEHPIIVRNEESGREACSSPVSANNISGISVNPINIFKNLRQEFTKDTPSTVAVHRLPVQPAPYKRLAQQVTHQDKTALPTPLRNPLAFVPDNLSATEGKQSPEHLTIMCFVNGINVTVDEARTLLNSHISPPTLVTEKSTVVYTKEQLQQFYAHCSSFHMQILEISTNNKRNLLEELKARKLKKHTNDRPSPTASSPDSSRRLIIDEAVIPTSLIAHSLPPDFPPTPRISPHPSTKKNTLPEPTAYYFEPVTNTNSNTSDLAAKKSKNDRLPNSSPKNLHGPSAQSHQTPLSKPVKRTATYEGVQIPPRKVPLAEYTNSDYKDPRERERQIYCVEQNRPGGLPVYENISPPPGQYRPHRANHTEYEMNCDEQQFYGLRNPMWRDHRLSSPQHQELMHPMQPQPYFLQRPWIIQPSVEMRQTYAPQKGWYSPPIIPNREDGIRHFYNQAKPISSDQMNFLAKQNLHFQRQVRHPGGRHPILFNLNVGIRKKGNNNIL